MTAQGGGYNPQPLSAVPVCDLTEAEDKEVMDAEYQKILKDNKKTQEDF